MGFNSGFKGLNSNTSQKMLIIMPSFCSGYTYQVRSLDQYTNYPLECLILFFSLCTQVNWSKAPSPHISFIRIYHIPNISYCSVLSVLSVDEVLLNDLCTIQHYEWHRLVLFSKTEFSCCQSINCKTEVCWYVMHFAQSGAVTNLG